MICAKLLGRPAYIKRANVKVKVSETKSFVYNNILTKASDGKSDLSKSKRDETLQM